MKRKRILLPVGTLILVTLLVDGIVRAQDGGAQSPSDPTEALTAAALAPLGTGFTYQGRLDQDGSPVNDTCNMRFRLYDAASAGSQVGSTISTSVPITDGYFTVNLDFAGAFDGDRRWLEIRVDCDGGGYTNLGRQELTAAPYALYAARSGGPQNVITVAQSNGDYPSIQTAIDSITDATESNPYLVWVAPGVYNETVTMKPYVHLQGAGQEATVITSTATSGSSPPSQATLILAQDTSVRDLTVGNGGTGSRNAALLATDGTTRTLVADVTARAQGDGTRNYAIFLNGSGTRITLQHVTGLAENGSSYNYGLYNYNSAGATLHGGSFTGRGGIYTRGIHNSGSTTTLEAEDVIVLAENGSNSNYGLYNGSGAETTLRGGSFTARGGTSTRGIYNSGSGTTLETEDVIVLAENGSDSNYGLYNGSGAETTLHGGSFTARGGLLAWGIVNNGSGATLQATGVIGLGENGSEYNHGLYNGSATTEVDSSRFTGSTWGLHQDGGTVRLGVTQLDGGANRTSGTLTCFQVYDGSYADVTCP